MLQTRNFFCAIFTKFIINFCIKDLEYGLQFYFFIYFGHTLFKINRFLSRFGRERGALTNLTVVFIYIYSKAELF